MSAGNWIAIAVAVVSGLVTVSVTNYVQWRQDRRDKRQRVHASFRKVLMAALRLVGTTAPFGGLAWKDDEDMTDAERNSFYDLISEIQRDLQDASVDLTLEGITGPVDQVEQMFQEFGQLRYWHSRAHSADEVRSHLDAVNAIADSLRRELPKVVDGILPDRPWWRPSWSLFQHARASNGQTSQLRPRRR